MKKLVGKVAVVTGGSAGIGYAIAKRFVAEGATVFIMSRRQTELDAAVQGIGKGITGVCGDVSVMADLDRLYGLVKDETGHIDILCANAACGSYAPIDAVTEGHVDQMLSTNVKGTVFTVQKALPLMTDGGSIILTGSMVSIVGTPMLGIYSATKAAVRSLARSWILDLRPRRIRVNVVSPGPTRTPGLFSMLPAENLEAVMQGVINGVPSGRVGEPEDVANAALFLASQEASFINGIELFVDGGTAQI
ncbi:SDR family NAD(P)-dependent oxidoreductase [Burkholderia sp. S171]|uniref:SDR family NAD(P)-dependent oxidoreductase n=1 Tax=Burkholderia sp. S171 TaxID=1641860 RepID=UPI00131A67A9|nr:SDR family oxidoreductase [Burkholderia sp. S171]